MTGPLSELRFEGEWRKYQLLALSAFQADVAAGRRRTHVVAPPGSGKTLLGVEMARRLGHPAVVLAPNTAIQAQWPLALARFGDVGGAFAALTYQSVCRVDDPGRVFRRAAEAQWAADRARATGEETPGKWTGAAAERRERELARIVASLKREALADAGVAASLLAPGARERVEALRGVGTVILDECHHLASTWGYLVEGVLELLGDVHVIGLTATPPAEMTAAEAELYTRLLADVDFTVPTPAVVRDGFLAPYQELAWLTEPLRSERAWLAEHDQRFAELVTKLHDLHEGDALSFPEWVIRRMRSGEPWERFQKRRPALARAGMRFLLSAGLEVPDDAPRGEAYRRAPDLEDWLVLLEDWALRCLAPGETAEASARYDAVAAALRDLGFSLTRQGLRRGTSSVDRLLTASAAKPLALVEILATEAEARGDDLRALVLCDAERATARADDELRAVLDAQAGTAARALPALGDDLRTAPLRPLLVTGRALRCLPADAPFLAAALGCQGGEEDGDGLCVLSAEGEWAPRRWVAVATEALRRGDTGVLVGTRALLGEGWDAPHLNVLVDLSAATTGVSVRQMRGRTLRLDPADPEKIASNWDVVCVAPDLARGTADYERFVRKHLHVLAPAEDGLVEAGPSHVHPELSPFGPPPAEDFAEINRRMRSRAAGHREARARWRIGEPYAGVDQTTLVVRPRVPATTPTEHHAEPSYAVDQRVPVGGALLGALAGAAGLAAGLPALAAGLVLLPLGLGAAAVRLARTRANLAVAAPLDLVGGAVADALVAVGELRAEAAASLVVEPRTSGYLRVRLVDADADESRRFAAAMEEVLAPVGAPRYLVSRLVAPPGRSTAELLGRTLLRRRPFDLTWHAVPAALGTHKARAEAFHDAWQTRLGPSELRFTQRSDEARRLLASAAAEASEHDVQIREAWV